MSVVKVRPRHQITIPKEIFNKLHLEEGDFIEAKAEDQKIVLVPKKLVTKADVIPLSKEEQKRAIEAELFTEKILIDIMKEGQKKGLFRPLERELLGAALKAMLQDWYLKRWKYARRGIRVEKYAGFLIDLIEAYLLAR